MPLLVAFAIVWRSGPSHVSTDTGVANRFLLLWLGAAGAGLLLLGT